METSAQKEKKCPCTKADCEVHGDCVACCTYLLCINKAIANLPFCLTPENKYAVPYDLLARVINRLEGASLVSETYQHPAAG